MAESQEERDEDSAGENSDDEIAELRIQALLTKKVNEAEVSPSRGPASSSIKSMSKSHPADRSRSYRHPQGDNHGQPIGRIPVVGASNYVVDLTPSHGDGEYHSNYNTSAETGKNFNKQRVGNYSNTRGQNRGRGRPGQYGNRRGGHQNFGNNYSTNSAPPAQSRSSPLLLPQDKYNKSQQQLEPDKSKEKMSARWRRMQGSDSESDSEDTETDSSDTSSDSSASSNSSSDSSSSDSESNDSSIQKRKVGTKDVKKEVAGDSTKSVSANANKTLQRQHSNKILSSKSPPKNVGNLKASAAQKNSGVPFKSSHSPPPKKYSGSQPQKPLSKQLSRQSSDGRMHSPDRLRQGSRSPVTKTAGKSPLAKKRSLSRSITPQRKRSRSPAPWRDKASREKSRSPLPRRFQRRGSRSPRRSLSPLARRGRDNSPVRRSSKSPLPRRGSIGRRISRSPFARKSRSPYRRYSRSPYGRTRPVIKNSLGRSTSRGVRSSRSPIRRRGSRSPPPLRRRVSLSPLPRRDSRSPIRRRNSRSPLPLRSSRSPLANRGPVSKRSSRSPLPRRSSRSPLLSPRFRRSPLPRRNSKSPQRSPIRRGPRGSPRRGSRSPLRRRSRSPFLRRNSRSPYRLGGRSPVHRAGSRSPLNRDRSRSSHPRQKSRSPQSTVTTKNSAPLKGSRSPVNRLHSRSPYREQAKSHDEKSRLSLEQSRKRGSRSHSPRPWRGSRSPIARKGSKSPLHKSSRSPLSKTGKSPFKSSKGAPQKKRSSPNKEARSPLLQRVSKSPLQHRMSSRSPIRKNSPRKFSKSPHRLSRSPRQRRFSRSSRSRSPALRRISRSPLLSRHFSRTPPRRGRDGSPLRGSNKSPHRLGSPSRKSYSPNRRTQRFSASPRSHRPGNKTYKRSLSPEAKRGSLSPMGRSPSPGERRPWRGNRSKSPRSRRVASPYARNSRSLTPPVTGARGRSPLRNRNQRGGRGGRGGFNRQNFDRTSNKPPHKYPQGNSLAGRLEFPPGYTNFDASSQHYDEFSELDTGAGGRSGWSQGGRNDRDNFTSDRLYEDNWEHDFRRDLTGPESFEPLERYEDRGPISSHQGSVLPSNSRGRGRGRANSPKPLLYRPATPPPLLGRSPPRLHSSNRYGDGPNDRRRRYSPNRLPRGNERSRSSSPYASGKQVYQENRGRHLSPRERRGPRTPPIPSNRNTPPRQTWGEGKGNRGSSPYSVENPQHYPRSNSPSHQPYSTGRHQSPSFGQRNDDLRDRLGREGGSHLSLDRKKRKLQDSQKTDNRSRINNPTGRGRGGRGGARGRRPTSPSDRNRRGVQSTEESGQLSRNWDRKGEKGLPLKSKNNIDLIGQSPERHGRNGSPWLEPITPEKQSQNNDHHPLTPPLSTDETQKDKGSSKQEEKVEKNRDKEKIPHSESKPKEEDSFKNKKDSLKKDQNKASELHHKKTVVAPKSHKSSIGGESRKGSVKAKDELPRPEETKKNEKEKEEKEDSEDKKKKKKKKKYKKLEEGEDVSDDVSVKSKSSKKKKKEKKKKKDSKKKKKKHKKADDSDDDDDESPRSKSQKDGRRDPAELPDLRQTLKRKVDGVSEKGSIRLHSNEMEDKHRRKDRMDDYRSRQNDTGRKRRHDSTGKPLLITVGTGDDRKVISGRPSDRSEKPSGRPSDRSSDRRGGNSSSHVSVHDRLGPAKSSWEESKSNRGPMSGGGTGGGGNRQKRTGDRSRTHHQGGGGSSNNNNNRMKMRR